jgi:beta-fructofuranosidase
MKKAGILLVIGLAFIITGCKKLNSNMVVTDNKVNPSESKEEIIEEVTIFPMPDNGFVGDPMPYYDGDKMNIFFLNDQRGGSQGYHPWARYTTTDFCKYEFLGDVIPYGDDITKQDIALGTGSVIKDEQGLYHAFYTGHNDTYSPKEAIMHATSTDLQNWDKHEEDTFYADKEYSSDDFRDPYVFYNKAEEKYWMLVTTRKNNMGVIALYKSVDLIHWKNEKVLFENDMGSDTNMECPTLIEWNGYWYLSFSDQWPDRVVHYRIGQSPEGSFEKPERDYLDGNGFYAGRLEKAEDKMYLTGWNATKDGHQDENNYNWAGNLVTHQVVQQDSGLLSVIPVQSVIKAMNDDKMVSNLYISESVTKEGEAFHFSGVGYENVSFPEIENSTKITGILKLNDKANICGFTFNLASNNIGTLNFVLNKQEGYIGFYNKPTDIIQWEAPQSKIRYSFEKGEEIPFTILIDNTVATLYLDNEISLTARMYSANNKEWGFFANNSNVTLKDIKVYK